MYRRYFKRLFDFAVALGGLILISPVFIVLTIILIIANQGHPFFLQKRPGKNEKIFKVVKFKSMNDKKDERGDLLPDGARLTKAGAFIRRTSLDEIPQLINVLVGDMSLIGPRPLLIRYLPYYTTRERLRHQVRPGITGWAQVHGRNTLSWNDKLEYDVHYVETLSFSLDLKIILLTFKKVLRSDGVSVVSDDIESYLDEERTLQH